MEMTAAPVSQRYEEGYHDDDKLQFTFEGIRVAYQKI
jgi:hypothetical protein